MRDHRPVDVIVIGSGITGTSCSYHLRRLGYKTKMISSPLVRRSTPEGKAIACAGTSDLITRMSDARGVDFAEKIWAYYGRAMTHLLSYLQEKGIPVVQGGRYYFSKDALEQSEHDAALVHAAFSSASIATPKLALAAIQQEPKTLCFDIDHLLTSLCEGEEVISDHVCNISQTDGGTLCIETQGNQYTSEMVVLAAHAAIGDFDCLPDGSLVPYEDQAILLESRLPSPYHVLGNYYSWKHNHFWVQVIGERLLRVGGARFLRDRAGIGGHQLTIHKKSADLVCQSVQDMFACDIGAISIVPTVGCLPCDEVAVIGPSTLNDRILLATGFGSVGLSGGFEAGRCLAQMVDSGVSSDLPREFWPERLRHFGG
ncbi:MAG: FAD-binding oxidoreductase [Pseudobacteriovorax sp.]|nr:FAD-binding oxidoreductase [Pseudobacteriovorax sp.]